MLSRILEELEKAGGPLEIDELSRRLGVQRSALDGMIETLVRKGRLREVEVGETPPMCAGCAKRSGCLDMSGSMGKVYEVVRT